MIFQHPQYLVLAIVVFASLGLWSNRKRQYFAVAAKEQIAPANRFRQYIIKLPLACWFLVSLLFAGALANPYTEYKATTINTLGKKAMLAVDASVSMGRGSHGSALDNIKVMLKDFSRRRIAKGDFMGISAYSGQSNSSRGFGYARVIQYPTSDATVVESAINILQPSIFGHYSAVGDGILVSIIALIEPEARQALGDMYDRQRLENSIWSIGSDNEDSQYAQEVAVAIGKQKGKYIVLFSDGKFNTGLDPTRALWFAQRIGLKIHFISFESTGATGLKEEEQFARKEWTIKSVLRTGGTYKESSDVNGVRLLLDEIDHAEQAEIIVEEGRRKNSRKLIFLFGAALGLVIWTVVWLGWGDSL
jgi:hypothetical protein